jgi:hypothetical protein
MLTSNSDQIYKEILKYKAEVKRKLEAMVRGFALDIVRIAVKHTPLGDAKQYPLWYQRRYSADSRFLPVEGFAQGSWQIQYRDSFPWQFNFAPDQDIKALMNASLSSEQYKLGKDIWVGNAGPYIAKLEAGRSTQAPQGIMQPTLNEIMQVYQLNLKQYYDRG